MLVVVVLSIIIILSLTLITTRAPTRITSLIKARTRVLAAIVAIVATGLISL
jgi:hypothetical protein